MGTTCLTPTTRRRVTVHPHGRGDNHAIAKRRRVDRGSPPRAWGQRPQAHRSGWRRRFTPTGVGTTSAVKLYHCTHSVHPHGRGDNEYDSTVTDGVDGSPPRAWGQLQRVGFFPRCHRFTPTGVGTTAGAVKAELELSVHPHGRGDNYPTLFRGSCIHGSPPRAWGQRLKFVCHDCNLGSPPRAWGQHGAADRRQGYARFTPTGVGTTVTR